MTPSVRALCAAGLLALSLTAQTPEQAIDARDKSFNGIVVGSPKVFDDSLLQQMLGAAQARLSSLQLLDQSGIAGKLGAVTGASQSIAGLSVNGQGIPAPQVATTVSGSTQSTVTTAPQVSAPTATAPTGSTSIPSSFSVSASDILNEQMQLTYEIANLRLLLEGSLDDHIVENAQAKTTTVKPRATIGFPIAIAPDARFKNAMAVVEVMAETEPTADLTGTGTPPSITALLPREKTYNVASITDHSVSLGGGMVTAIAGVSGSFLWGHKTYYVVKDQDTVALTWQPEKTGATAFLWQFRPVLGESFVQSGLRQTFVQLAFPAAPQERVFGSVFIRSYWRKYDRKTGLAGNVIPGSISAWKRADIPQYSMKQSVAAFSAASLEDIGGGQMLVEIPGSFLGGTYVRLGGSILQAGSAGFTFESRFIRFVAPVSDLASKPAFLVSRDGTEVPLIVKDDALNMASNPIAIESAAFTAIDETNSLLRIELQPMKPIPALPLMLLIGGRAFGCSDAPLARTGNTLSIALPTAFLYANPQITVKPLMADTRYFAAAVTVPAGSEPERLVAVSQNSTGVTYVIFGGRLDRLTVVSPPKAALGALGSGSTPLRTVEIPLDLIKTQKLLVLQRDGEPPFTLAIPAPSSGGNEQPAPVKPQFKERVTVGSDTATITGEGLDAIDKVLFGAKELKIVKQSPKSLEIRGLAAAGATSSAATQDITLVLKRNETVKLEVVTARVETIGK